VTTSQQNIAIIGGGATGCAAAYFLALAGADQVCVIEPDPTYAKAATPVATGGCRRLFARPENIQMSQFSIEFFKSFGSHVAVNGAYPDVAWHEGGYLFVATAGQESVLEENYRTQTALGVNVELMEPKALAARYPWMNTSDLSLAVLSPEDGWLDPNSVLQGLKKKAQALGVTFITDRVVDLYTDGTQLSEIELASGNRLRAHHYVNAAGCWAASIAKLAGVEVPVNPMRRFEHYVEIETPLPPMPLIKCPERLVVRPEGKGYAVGLVNSHEPRGFNYQLDPTYFERVVWPALAQRMPAFESLKLKREWVGLYDECELDGNMILGNWPGRLDNFYVACGFSGHGLMHAPAVGRALSELILHGDFQTLNLSRMGTQRVIDNAPYAELGII